MEDSRVKIREILAQAIYESKYSVLTKGYQEEVDRTYDALIFLWHDKIKALTEENEKLDLMFQQELENKCKYRDAFIKAKAELEQVRKEYHQETSEDRATSDWHGQPKDEQAKEINRLEKEVYRLKAQLATKPKLTREALRIELGTRTIDINGKFETLENYIGFDNVKRLADALLSAGREGE